MRYSPQQLGRDAWNLPGTYVGTMLRGPISYALGNGAGFIIKGVTSGAFAGWPRLVGLGLDDAATVVAGGGMMLYGEKLVPVGKASTEAFGAGILTAWLLSLIFGGLSSAVPPNAEAARVLAALDREYRSVIRP